MKITTPTQRAKLKIYYDSWEQGHVWFHMEIEGKIKKLKRVFCTNPGNKNEIQVVFITVNQFYYKIEIDFLKKIASIFDINYRSTDVTLYFYIPKNLIMSYEDYHSDSAK